MTMDYDAELKTAYDDLLEGSVEERHLRLLRYLDAGYRPVHHGIIPVPPAVIREPSPARRVTQAAYTPEMPHRRKLPSIRRLLNPGHRYRLSVPVLAVFILALCVTLALAAGNILNLGKPTNSVSTNPHFPLSGFHRAGPVLRAHGKPELLWIGTAWLGDAPSDAERWPVVKALQQFGTFSGIVAVPPHCTVFPDSPFIAYGKRAAECSLATFDWTHAHFTSRYLVFEPAEMLDAKGHILWHLTAVETQLFNRYLRTRPGNKPADIAASIGIGVQSLYGPPNQASHHFPLLSIGGYLQTITQIPMLGDLAGIMGITEGEGPHPTGLIGMYYTQPLSFTQVHNALLTGETPSIPASQGNPAITFPNLVSDINAEANVITALICHADGGKPGKVCGRPVIQQILKHVK